jgi:hypothetical protein
MLPLRDAPPWRYMNSVNPRKAGTALPIPAANGGNRRQVHSSAI